MVYSYCSYQSSPVGFKVGRFHEDTKENKIVLQDVSVEDAAASAIIKAFQRAEIQSMYGRLPKSKQYVVMVKNLEYGVGTKKYFNFAFQFDDGNACQKFANQLYGALQREKEKTIAAINDFVVIEEKDAKYGLYIDKQKFDHWKKMLGNGNKAVL